MIRVIVQGLKYKVVLAFIFSVACSGVAYSQTAMSAITSFLLEPCPIKTIPPLTRCTPPVLETQQDVDAFESVEVVLGHLQIEAETELDLSPFDNLREIQGILYLDRGNLTTINGFNNLESIGTRAESFGYGHQIYIDSNPQLTSISGFQKLKKSNHPEAWAPSIFIRFNPLLRTINGFNALDNARTVSIRYNSTLQTVTGFDSLQTLDGGLYITNSTGLTSLPLFSYLRTISGGLELYDLPGLNSLSPFRALTYARTMRVHNLGISELSSFSHGSFHLTQSLSITENENLTRISGFSNLLGIEGERGDLYIHDNDILDEVTGFNRLITNDPTDYISISRNPRLDCHAELFMLEPVAYSQGNLTGKECVTAPYDFGD